LTVSDAPARPDAIAVSTKEPAQTVSAVANRAMFAPDSEHDRSCVTFSNFAMETI